MKIAIKSCFTTLVEDTTLIQNAATPYPVEFAFSKDWDGFAKTALFEAGVVQHIVDLFIRGRSGNASLDLNDHLGQRLVSKTRRRWVSDDSHDLLVGADAGTRNVYDSYGVSADNVTTSGQMTFRCDTTPTVDLSVFIIRLEVGTDE